MSFDRNGNWRAAELGETLLKVLIGTYSRGMLVQFSKLFDESYNLLLINRRFSGNPLGLCECILYIVEAWGRTVNLRNLMWKTLVFVIFHNLGLQSAILVELLINIKCEIKLYIIDGLIFVWRSLLSLKLSVLDEAVSIVSATKF